MCDESRNSRTYDERESLSGIGSPILSGKNKFFLFEFISVLIVLIIELIVGLVDCWNVFL